MTRRLGLDRRKFLASVGATALTVPFLRVLPGYAQTDDKRYLILVFTANGVVRDRWGVNVTGSGPSDFTFKEYLAPLTPFKDRVNVFDGLNNRAAQGSHEAGMASLWTGVNTSGQLATGPSIDQHITRQARFATRYPSLEFYVKSPQDYNSKSVQTRMIYSAGNTPVDPRDNADIALELFAGVTGGPPTPDPRIAVRREKLFAHVQGELGELAPRLCNEDQAHLDALRTGFETLRGRLANTAPPPAVCQVPVTDTAGLAPYPEQSKQMIDILAMSIACDFTRVASLQFSHALSQLVPTFLSVGGSPINENFHDISHQQPPPNTSAASWSPAQRTVVDKLTAINVFHAEQIAYLCERLASFPGQNGKTLLDQCVICWGNELDHGQYHNHVNTPFVTIGSAGGRLVTGQNFVFQPDERAHNDLLVSLATAMGVTTQSFGAAEHNRGVIPGLLSA
jgi:hypothetical protein